MNYVIMTVLAIAAGDGLGWAVWKTFRIEHRVRNYIYG